MSKFILNEKTESNFQDGFIMDATFVYVCVQEAKTKYGKKDEYEYSTGLVVDEDTYDAFAAEFPKNVSNSSIVKTEAFKERFCIDPVYPEAKKQYVIVLKAPRDDFNGVPIPDDAFKRPKVYVPSGNNSVSEITLKTLVANGSKGDVNFWVSHSKEFGSFPKLHELLVKELIVYEKKASNQSSFGTVVNPEARRSSFETQEREPAPEASEEDEF
jgi:hypothetical protein